MRRRAVKYLANLNASNVTLIGAGKQARLQLQGLRLVRDIKKVFVWSHTKKAAASFAEAMSDELEIPVLASEDIAFSVNQADIVVTTTPSRKPLIRPEWLKSGAHITAVGADAPYKTELHPECIANADYYICDSYEQCERLGELRGAKEAGVVDDKLAVFELGDVITGKQKIVRKESDISICDLTGLGIQDTEIAVLARSLCQ